jgi:prepilin peptidase CpaA
MQTEHYLQIALLLLISIAAVNDIATRRIPNRLLLAGLACALLLHLFSAAPGRSLFAAFEGMLTGFLIFLPFYLLRGMAAGDVKLMAVIGAFTGPGVAFEIALLTWCVGGLMALVTILLRGRLRLALDNLRCMLFGVLPGGVGLAASAPQNSAGSMPYGLAIAAGTVVALVRHYG